MPQQNNSQYDLLLIGAASGIAGIITKDLLELLVLLFMPTFSTCPQLAAGIVLNPKQAKESILPLIGLEIDLAVGIIVGIIVVLALTRFGFDHWMLKGIVLGLLAWTIIEVTLANYLSSIPMTTSVLAWEISLLIHFIYGMIVVGAQRAFLKEANNKRRRD